MVSEITFEEVAQARETVVRLAKETWDEDGVSDPLWGALIECKRVLGAVVNDRWPERWEELDA